MYWAGMDGAKTTSEESGSEWLSVSDLMAGLMMVFLCLAIFMMNAANKEREKVRTLAQSYMENQLAIYQSLHDEFEHDFQRWGAKLDKERLEVTFQSSNAMFATGEVNITEAYQAVFTEFFPRYMNVLEPYQGAINGVRIEGHTNSSWSQEDDDLSYFKNLALSQQRAKSVFEFLFFLGTIEPYRDWILANVAAVGYSSSQPIMNSAGEEDAERSKRVVFRVMSSSDERIRSMLEAWPHE